MVNIQECQSLVSQLMYSFPKEHPPDWAENMFQVPTRFPNHTNECIESGILTQRAQDEFVNSLATLMLVFTIRPTRKDYETVAAALVRVHPSVKDTSSNGYVSL